MGALRLEQMFPLTLGANIGTTVTGLLASLVNDGTDSLQVALCHLFFNITGIIIWYPIPFMRRVPLNMAKALGKTTRTWRGFPIVYIIVIFGLLPLLLLGLSSLFNQESRGFTVLGSLLTILLISAILFVVYKWTRGGLKESTIENFERRERKNKAVAALPDDMDYVKSELVRLREHTGLPEPTPDPEKAKEDDMA